MTHPTPSDRARKAAHSKEHTEVIANRMGATFERETKATAYSDGYEMGLAASLRSASDFAAGVEAAAKCADEQASAYRHRGDSAEAFGYADCTRAERKDQRICESIAAAIRNLTPAPAKSAGHKLADLLDELDEDAPAPPASEGLDVDALVEVVARAIGLTDHDVNCDNHEGGGCDCDRVVRQARAALAAIRPALEAERAKHNG